MAIQNGLNWDKANDKAIEKALNDVIKINEKKALQALGFVAEKTINLARSGKNYEDQTGNLKGSTGYVINEGSKLTKQDFGGSGGAGADGKKIGLSVAKEASNAKKDEIQLVITAGMEYAEQLETKEYQVLTFALPSIIKFSKELELIYKKK